MKNKILFSLLISLVFSSCTDVYDKGYSEYSKFPLTVLENSGSSQITVDSYFFDPDTNTEKLWISTDIAPGSRVTVIDWVYPLRIVIKDQSSAVLYKYSGNNDGWEEGLPDSGTDLSLVSSEYVFNYIKYDYANLPQADYDLNMHGTLSPSGLYCGMCYVYSFSN